MKKGGKIVRCIFALIAFLVSLALLIVAGINLEKTEKSAAKITATVESVRNLGNEGERDFYLIYTKEHDNGWHVNTFLEEELQVLNYLNYGDKITFLIDRKDLSAIDKMLFIEMISLKTEERSLYSVDDYNIYNQMEMKPIRELATACFGITGLFLIWSVCALFKKKNAEGVL